MSTATEHRPQRAPADEFRSGISRSWISGTTVIQPDPRIVAVLGRLSRGASAIAIVVGVLVLIGWALDVALMKSVGPGLATMKPTTALAFILAGVSLWASQFEPADRRARFVSLCCSAIVIAIGLLTLSEALFAWDLGIELLLFEEAVSAAGNVAPRRMAPAAALNFVLIGAALQILALRGKRRYRFAQFLALIVLAISTTAILGYAYDVDALYQVAPYSSMALHTAIVFTVLSAGIVFAIAVRGESSLLTSPGMGGMILRILWLPSIGIVFVVSWLRLGGEKAGLYTTGFGLAIMVVLSMIVTSGFLWFIARRLDQVDARRKRTEDELRENKRRLEDMFASVAEGIVSIDKNLRIVLFNPAAEQMFGRSWKEMHGQPLNVLIPERFRGRHEEYIRRFDATGQTNRSMGQYGLIYGLRASGEEFPIEATISQTGISPNKLLTVILNDVTKRRQAEDALRDYSEQLRRLSRRLFEVQETERRRLARELHDRIGQNVTALNLILNMVRNELPADYLRKVSGHLNDCETLLYSTGQLVRDVMADLRPPGLDELGLLAALTEHARRIAKPSEFSVTVRGTELTPRLPPAAEIILFRIAQEALVNVAKHAHPTEVTISLESRPDVVVLTVADNGRGFDAAAQPAKPSSSLGMVSMRERADSIGGRLRVESAPGHGTRVIVEAPRAAPSSSKQAHLPGLEPA